LEATGRLDHDVGWFSRDIADKKKSVVASHVRET
jgi:hypothetical protein